METDRVKQYIEISLRFQRRNRFVIRATNSDLLVSEVHLLGEIYASPGIRVKEYAERMCSAVSTTYRALQRFNRQGWLKYGADLSIGATVSLSATGRRLHDKTSKDLAGSVAGLSACLSLSQVNQITDFLKKMNDNLGAPITGSFLYDTPLRAELRRQTRIFGILGSDYLESGYTNAQVQVLWLISDGRYSTQKLLIDELGTTQITVVQILKALRDRGMITEVISAEDRRVHKLELTSAGRKDWRGILSRMSKFLSSAFKGMSDSEIESGMRLLAKMAGVSDVDWCLGSTRQEPYVLEIGFLSYAAAYGHLILQEGSATRTQIKALYSHANGQKLVGYFINGQLTLIRSSMGEIIWGELPNMIHCVEE